MPEQDWNGFADDGVLLDTDVFLVARGPSGINIPGSAVIKKDASGNAQIGNPATIKARFHIRGPGSEITTLTNAVTNAALLIEPWQGSAWGLAIGSLTGQIQCLQGVDTSGSAERDIALNPLGGNVVIGTNATLASARLRVLSASNGAVIQCGNGLVGAYMSNTSGVASWAPFSFCNNGNSLSQIGSISCNSTTTFFNTTSDYRLKNNVRELSGSGEFIDALRPCAWDWVQDGSQGAGFIAHEFAEVSPTSVHGKKDEMQIRTVVDELTGEESEVEEPRYQSMQPSSPEVMAHIIAELQSVRRRLAEAEAKIEELSR